MKLGMQVDLGPGHIVLDGDPSSPTKKGAQLPPLFGPCLLWPNGWMDKMPLSMEVGLGPGHIVLDGDLAPPSKRAYPQISAHVSCDQTTGLIKMPLGTKIVIDPVDIVLDGKPTSPP